MKIDSQEELYKILDNTIEQFTEESINRETFNSIINELNSNEFGIVIDPNLVPDNRESFNEIGQVSYLDDDETSY